MAYGALGEHRITPDIGYPDGLLGMAGERGIYYYSYLPDFSFEVGMGTWSEDEEEPEEADRAKLDYSKLSNITLLNAVANYTTNTVDQQNYHSGLSITGFTTPSPAFRKALPVQVNGITFAEGRNLEDYDVYWRYWKEGDTAVPAIQQVTALPTKASPLSSGTLKIQTENFSDILFGELILIPKDPTAGFPATHSVMATAMPINRCYGLPYVSDLKIIPVGNGNDYSLTDGLLKTDAGVTYDGNQLDLGYGFLVSERNYTVTVPYSTSELRLQPIKYALPQGSGTYIEAELSVNGVPFQTLRATDYEADFPSGELETSDAISLNEDGTTVITVTVRFTDKLPEDINLYSAAPFYTQAQGITYTLTVQKAEAPRQVAIDVPDNVRVTVKNELTKKSVAPQGDAIYNLGSGDYTCTFTGTDYLKCTSTIAITKNGDDFTVTADGQALTAENDGSYLYTPTLTPAPRGEGEITVRIVGVDSVVRETTVGIPNVTPDLTHYVNALNPEGKLSYVRENNGGYTALHAVIDALLQEDTIRFACVSGKLMPGLIFSKIGHGENWGWRCRVNNEYCIPAETILMGNETVTFYYDAALDGQKYAWFTENAAEVARNRTVSFTLNGVPAAGSGEPVPITGATICLNGEAWTHVTESDGIYTLTDLYDVPLGQHIVTARIDNGNGVNQLTNTEVKLTVTASESGGSSGEMTQGNALDAVYAAFDAVVNRAYGKASFEAIRAVRDGGVAAISGASSGFDAMAASAIAAINAEAAKYSVNKALGALVPHPDGYVTVSIEDWGIRLPESDLDYPMPLGILIPATRVPYVSGDNMGDVTLRLLNALGIKATHSYNSQYGSMYLESVGEFYMPTGEYVKMFGELDSGSGSGWMVSLNGWFMNMGVSYFEVENGDVIRWQNTCQIGSDIGANNKTAKLLGLVFKANPGRLSPAFNDGVKQFIYTIPKSLTAIRMAARPESGMAEVTYTSDDVLYQPMEMIPVTNGTVIEIVCQYKGSGNTVIDERRLMVTIQVEGEATVKPGGVAGETTKLTPKVTAVSGIAAVTISADDVAGVIADAKDNGSGAIVIAPQIAGTANKVTVDVPKTAVASIASETDADMTVETPVGNITMPNDVLASIASQASGSNVTMSLEAVNTSTLTAAQQVAVGDDPVYDISILSGGTHISSFGGGTITISLPYTLKPGEDPANVTIWYLNDAGKLEQMTCTYDEETGLATFTTDHLSYYVAGYDEWVNPFADVKTTDWFYKAVKYTAKNTLFEGITPTAFAPKTPMTRAMLVTVLYRLEGKPSVTAVNVFTDVKNGEWYTNAVIWANANNIATGGGGGLFGTDDSVTREQMAAILYNYAKYKGYDVTASANLSVYTDAADINSWALAAMKWANTEGLVTGRTTTTLAPGGDASRAEVAEILMRFVSSFNA